MSCVDDRKSLLVFVDVHCVFFCVVGCDFFISRNRFSREHIFHTHQILKNRIFCLCLHQEIAVGLIDAEYILTEILIIFVVGGGIERGTILIR